jgi:hypothetical protein
MMPDGSSEGLDRLDDLDRFIELMKALIATKGGA